MLQPRRFFISIHSLVKRETTFHTVLHFFQNYFNPLPRKEGDTLSGICIPENRLISIHSLVKRETPDCSDADLLIKNFNPLPRKEGDVSCGCFSGTLQISIHSLVKRETDILS